MTQHSWKNSIAITGAGSGFGAALASLYASRGWNVAVTDIDEKRARQTLQEIERHGGNNFSMQLDITSADQWQQVQDSSPWSTGRASPIETPAEDCGVSF